MNAPAEKKGLVAPDSKFFGGKTHLSVKSISLWWRCKGFIIKLNLSSERHLVDRLGSSALYKSANIVAFGKPSANILPVLKPIVLVYMIQFVFFIFSPLFLVLWQTLLAVLLRLWSGFPSSFSWSPCL